MAELDLDALEQAARDAGGGCWFSTGWTVGSRGFEVGDLKSRDRICSDATERCAEFIAAANPATILELLGRLKAAEKERDALRAKVARMGKQGPVAWADAFGEPFRNRCEIDGVASPLYALPGAQEQEPTRDWWDCLIADISAIDCMYRGWPTYAHDAYWMRDHVVRMLKKRRDSLLGAKGE